MNTVIEQRPATASPAGGESAADRARRSARGSAVNDCYADLDAVEAIIDCVSVTKPTPLLLAARHMVSAAHAKGADAVNAGGAADHFATFLDATHGAVEVLTTAAEEADDRALWGAAFLAQRAEQVLKDAEVDEPEAEEPDRALAEALRPLVSALSMLIHQAEQASQNDDPHDSSCDAAWLLSDAEAVVYGLAHAPSTDYFWQVASTATRAALSMVHRTLQEALAKPEGLGIAQMAMLPATITLAGRLVDVLDVVDPDDQLAAVRELETALRTGALLAGPASSGLATQPEACAIAELQELVFDYASGWTGEEGEALFAVAYLCDVAQAHVVAARKCPANAGEQLEEASLAMSRVEAMLGVIGRTVEGKAVGGLRRLAAAAHQEVNELLAQAEQESEDVGTGQH